MTACGFTAGSHFDVLDLTDQLIDAGADHVVGSMKDLAIRREHEGNEQQQLF
jgi:hypothetical protein